MDASIGARMGEAATVLKIVSGGQTGVDQAALRAAMKLGIPTGGWAPKGWETEEGPAPWLDDYGLRECPVPGYPARTAANVRDSDATIWVGPTGSRGYGATLKAASIHRRPFIHAPALPSGDWAAVHTAIESLGRLGAVPVVLNVAGNRESGNPGVGWIAEEYLLGALAAYAPEPTR